MTSLPKSIPVIQSPVIGNMNKTLTACPRCGHEFEVSKVTSGRLRAEMEVHLTAVTTAEDDE